MNVNVKKKNSDTIFLHVKKDRRQISSVSLTISSRNSNGWMGKKEVCDYN